MEAVVEKVLYASRWVLAPIYLGLSLALVLLGIKFFQEVLHVFPIILATTEADMVLVILSLVDMALVGGLIIMVMLSGYENFVSKIDIEEGVEKLDWLGKLDADCKDYLSPCTKTPLPHFDDEDLYYIDMCYSITQMKAEAYISAGRWVRFWQDLNSLAGSQ